MKKLLSFCEFSKKHKNLHIAHQFKTKNGNGVQTIPICAEEGTRIPTPRGAKIV
jgi:hypothetical protein